MNSTLMFTKWGRILGKKLMKPIQKYKPALQQKTSRWNIVTGDLVKVINGPQTGQQGKVLSVLRGKNRVVIDGVNMVSYQLKLAAFNLHIKLIKSKLTCTIEATNN